MLDPAFPVLQVTLFELSFPVALLIFFLVIGIPVAYAMTISATIGLLMHLNVQQTIGILQTVAYGHVVNYLLSTIPMFILMAEFLRTSELASNIFTAVYNWIGHYRGGLAHATTVASGGMAALSGSTTATAAAMSRIAVPEMTRYNYDERLAVGAVCAGGTFATMIPPSILLIIYGVLTETSIAALFIAGVIPGVLTVISYGITIFVWGRINPDVVGADLNTEKAPLGDRIDSLKPVWPAILIIILVIGGLYTGAVTPTEAGAVGAFGTLLVGVGMGKLGPARIKDSLLTAAETTVMIFMIIIGAIIFGRWLAVTRATTHLLEFVEGLTVAPIWILVIVLLIYLAMGTMMSGLAIMILTLPIAFPLITNLGYHPVWLGIILVKTIEIGLITPPFGLNVFVASSALDMEPDIGFRGSARFIAADLAIAVLLIWFPSLALWLPSQMG